MDDWVAEDRVRLSGRNGDEKACCCCYCGWYCCAAVVAEDYMGVVDVAAGPVLVETKSWNRLNFERTRCGS